MGEDLLIGLVREDDLINNKAMIDSFGEMF